jgi:hypothetical protein
MTQYQWNVSVQKNKELLYLLFLIYDAILPEEKS